MMSGDFASGSCPTYAVVDIKKKKKVAVSAQESSAFADIALYAVVDKTKKKEVLSNENYNVNDYTPVEAECTELHGAREEEPQPKYSVLHQHNMTSDVAQYKTSSLFHSLGEKNKKWKSAESISQLCSVIMIIAVLFLALAFAISTGISYTMISKLMSEIMSSKGTAYQGSMNKELVNSIQYELELLQNKTYNNSLQILANMKDIKVGLNNCNSDTSMFDLVNKLNKSIRLETDALNERLNLIGIGIVGNSIFHPAPSCQAIYSFQASSTSGYYWVNSSNGSSIRVYCEMTKSCGNVTGGLTRVALLNNENRAQVCTGDSILVAENSRFCAQNIVGCSHIVFPLMSIAYTHICGTVDGTYTGTPDGFIGNARSSSTTVNDNYVDGISLTYGAIPNKTHVWTFIADEEVKNPRCPRNVTDYVGNHYSCLKWEGFCLSNPESCSFAFFREFLQPVTENIELKLCRDDSNDFIHLRNLEIYVW